VRSATGNEKKKSPVQERNNASSRLEGREKAQTIRNEKSTREQRTKATGKNCVNENKMRGTRVKKKPTPGRKKDEDYRNL